jgi:hypothetical protein
MGECSECGAPLYGSYMGWEGIANFCKPDCYDAFMVRWRDIQYRSRKHFWEFWKPKFTIFDAVKRKDEAGPSLRLKLTTLAIIVIGVILMVKVILP